MAYRWFDSLLSLENFDNAVFWVTQGEVG